MKTIVFGATGQIGQQIMDQGPALGHHVTAFVRDPNKISNPAENVSVTRGDVLDPAAVSEAIKGHDAVICALGMPLGNKDGLRAKGTANIIQGMENAGVKRLICLSSLGTAESRMALPFHYRAFIIPLFLRHVVADHGEQEKLIKKSSLDWTIVRPGNFSKGVHTGKYHHGFSTIDKTLKIKISPADVADFMLWQLAEDVYVHKTPALSY